MSLIITFGKYRGKSCEEVWELDHVYVEWVLRTKSDNPWFIEVQEYFTTMLGRKPTKESPLSLPWWDVLEVRPQDSLDVIKKAYRKMMSLYHPDKVSQLGAELKTLAEKKSKEINEAYDKALKERS